MLQRNPSRSPSLGHSLELLDVSDGLSPNAAVRHGLPDSYALTVMPTSEAYEENFKSCNWDGCGQVFSTLPMLVDRIHTSSYP